MEKTWKPKRNTLSFPQINQSLPLEVLLSVLLIPEPATSGKKNTYEAEVL